MARETFMPSPFKVMAAGNMSLDTNSGAMAAHAGIVIAAPQPSAKVKARSNQALVMPISVHTPRIAAVTSIQSWVAMR